MEQQAGRRGWTMRRGRERVWRAKKSAGVRQKRGSASTVAGEVRALLERAVLHVRKRVTFHNVLDFEP
eukprot:2051634-Rhodomonas_salina.1